MKKPIDLRQHLVEAVPTLAKDPDKLDIFIERGAIASRLGGGLSFEYRYDLVLLFKDYIEHADTLMIPLLAWIAVHQPALLLNPGSIEQTIKFQAELIDHEKADIEITLALTEAVVVVAQPGGGYLATHIPEPALPDLGGEPGWELFVKGLPLAEL